jgi:hypothetical protein
MRNSDDVVTTTTNTSVIASANGVGVWCRRKCDPRGKRLIDFSKKLRFPSTQNDNAMVFSYQIE